MKPMVLGPQEQEAAVAFQSFCLRLAAVRAAIVAPLPAPAAADGTATDAEHRPISPDMARATLIRAIAELGTLPSDLAASDKVDAGYVMTAVADEVLLVQCPSWAIGAHWADEPLEAVSYGSRLAGDRLFTAAEDLVAGRREDARTATMILLALLGGFRGRYQGRADHGDIARLTTALYKIVCRRGYVAEDAAPYAAPDLAATTLTGASNRALPALWPWVAALVLLVLLYLPISHAEWWVGVQSVDERARTIIEDSENPKPIRQGPQ